MSYDPYSPRELDTEPRELEHQPREADPEYQYSPVKQPLTFGDVLRKLWAPIAAVIFAIWKLKFIFVAIFKFKLFTVAGSMLVSIGAYALLWGWQFAIGFVVLLLVHELGHVFEAKRQGLPVSAPMFIPFLGALIVLKELPDNAWNEAKVAIAGPIVGGLGAAAVWGLGEAIDSDLLVALAFTGFFLNLFNLAPISPLDGGRIVAAIHPALWVVGLLAAARAHDRRAEPDPDPDPRARRARVLAPLAAPAACRRPRRTTASRRPSAGSPASPTSCSRRC